MGNCYQWIMKSEKISSFLSLISKILVGAKKELFAVIEPTEALKEYVSC